VYNEFIDLRLENSNYKGLSIYPPYEYLSYTYFIVYYIYLGIEKASILPIKRIYLESAINSTPLYVKSFYRYREPYYSYLIYLYLNSSSL
jgi:hypothetical protein